MDIKCILDFSAGVGRCNEVFNSWDLYIDHMVEDHKVAEYVERK